MQIKHAPAAALLGAVCGAVQPAMPVAPAVASPAASAPASAVSRGRLLYENHCRTCHSVALHWRQGRLATDWTGLKNQVRAWQARSQLGWSEDEIDDVTRYLGRAVYRLPGPLLGARDARR